MFLLLKKIHAALNAIFYKLSDVIEKLELIDSGQDELINMLDTVKLNGEKRCDRLGEIATALNEMNLGQDDELSLLEEIANQDEPEEDPDLEDLLDDLFEEHPKPIPNGLLFHLIFNDASADEIKKAYISGNIAIVCKDNNEWRESIEVVSEWSEVIALTLSGKEERPINDFRIINAFNDLDSHKDFHCVQKTTKIMNIVTDKPKGMYFVIGNTKKTNVKDSYFLVNWSEIRDRFVRVK